MIHQRKVPSSHQIKRYALEKPQSPAPPPKEPPKTKGNFILSLFAVSLSELPEDGDPIIFTTLSLEECDAHFQKLLEKCLAAEPHKRATFSQILDYLVDVYMVVAKTP